MKKSSVESSTQAKVYFCHDSWNNNWTFETKNKLRTLWCPIKSIYILGAILKILYIVFNINNNFITHNSFFYSILNIRSFVS